MGNRNSRYTVLRSRYFILLFFFVEIGWRTIQTRKMLLKGKNDDDKNDLMLPFLFDLKEDCLIYVDSLEGLRTMRETVKDCILAGIDTERKPDFGSRKHPTALVQLATRSSSGSEKVFLIDLLRLHNDKKAFEELDQIFRDLFLSETCFKLGQGLVADMSELYTSFPELISCKTVLSVVDTEVLYRTLESEVPHMISLKKLVKNHLHLNLVKTEQLSDWAHRPLTSSQIHYAACDALVLLRLFDAMTCEIEYKMFLENMDGNCQFQKESLCRKIDLQHSLAALNSPLKRSNLTRNDSNHSFDSLEQPRFKKIKVN
jgi:ribonuclease D